MSPDRSGTPSCPGVATELFKILTAKRGHPAEPGLAHERFTLAGCEHHIGARMGKPPRQLVSQWTWIRFINTRQACWSG